MHDVVAARHSDDLACGGGRTIRVLTRLGHVPIYVYRPVFRHDRRDLICVYHDDVLTTVRCPLSKHLARQCGPDSGLDLRQGQSGYWKRADQWQRNSPVNLHGGTMPQLGNTRHRDFQYISDIYSIFGLRLGDRNCQANSHRAPFDATTEVTEDIDIETIAQSRVQHRGNFLYGRGHRMRSLRSGGGTQPVDIATIRATVQT